MKRLWRACGAQFIRFGLVGAVNTLVDYGVYSLVLHLMGKDAYLLGQLLGFTAGTLNAYFMNGRFVFRAEGKKGRARRLFRCFTGYGATCLLAALMLWVWVDKLGLNEYLAKLINLCVTVPLNFAINRFWTFAPEKPNS